jgi:hypothetical protein
MKLKLLLSTVVIVAFGIFSSAQSTINITTTLNGCCATEKWVSITDMADGAGTQIWGQGDGTYGNAQGLINQDIMLAPGTYWVNCYDRYADSWDGTTIDVTAYGASIGNNGGVSPDDGTDNDATFSWETPADELEASFMIVVLSPPSCTVPTAIVSSNITAASADFSWTASASETGGYNWEVVPQGDAQGVNVVSSGTTASGALTVTASGLSSTTPYDFYISTDCGATGMSIWAGPITFTTACATIVPDALETFDTFVPDCWEEAADGDLTTGPTGFGSGDWRAEEFAHSSTSGGGAVDINLYRAVVSDWIVSPLYDLSAGGYELNLDVALTDYNNTSAGVMGSDDFVALAYTTDGTSWTVLQTWDVNNQPATAGETYNDALTGITSAAVRFGIYATDGAVDDLGIDYDFHIDNFEVKTAPVCNDVSAVTIDSVTADSVTVSWTENSVPADTAWEVVAVAAGDPVPAVGTSNATSIPYVITGLNSSTAYDIYVRGDCSITFVGPVSVTTVAACGDTVYDTGGAAGNYSVNESYTITYLPDTAANVVTLDFTLVDLENCCDTLTIYDGLDTSAPVLEGDLQNPAVFSGFNPAGAITIEFTSDFSITGAGWEANYTCAPRPSCINVSNLTLQSAGPDSLTLSWTENNIPAGTAWEVVAVPAGDPAPVAGTSNATAIPYAITSLTANTSYDVYVRADCSTTFVGPLTGTTSCAIVTTYPYTTDFTNNVPNACWEEAGSGEIVDGPMTVGSSDWKAGRSYENFAGTAIPSNLINLYFNTDREWLLSEQYDMTGISNDVLSIEVAVTDYLFTGASDATDTATMGSDDQVDLLITTDAGMTWTSLMTWTVANQPAVDGTREFIDLSSYTGTVQFAFFASDGVVNDSEDYDFHVGMFIIDGTAGNEDVLASTLSLYPNPVHGDVVTIRMDSTSASSIEVAVFNTLGQQVMARSYDQVTNSIQIDNLSSLSKGMYFVKISTGGQQATLKFIKE